MTASMNAELPLPLQESTPTPMPMSFSGRGREFLKLLVVGSLFQIPTFGFYRFWLTTKVRRHLWANTRIEGEAFEYTGTAKELLIGFLIALAVLVPLYLAYFIVSIMAEEKYAFASLPLVAIMYVLAHFGSYRARRYRATRTVFRGVRFWMTGSGWAYALRAILWDIATILSLGLALPWAMASLERYRMRHTYFGSIQGDFVGTGWVLFRRGWWVWALGIVLSLGVPTLIAVIVVNFLVGEPAGEKASLGTLMASYAGLQLLSIFFLIAVPLALTPLAMAIFTRWQIEGLRFGDTSLSSRFRLGTYYGLFFKMISSSVGFLLLAAVVGGLCVFLFSAFFQEALDRVKAGELSPASLSFSLLITIAYLILILGLGVLRRYFLGRGLWAAMVNSIAVNNLHSVDHALASGQLSGTLGEGFADALDFNVGL
jgi:uncharacterized membrane protein YjgN (DUF898 family)